MRVSDADRDAVTLLLRDAAAEGRLTLEELTQRIELAYAARTTGELREVTADLPGPAPRVAPAPRGTRWTVAVMSGAEQKGRWRVEGETVAVAVMGGVELDLREAEIVGDEAVITCIAWMGGVEVTVPEGVDVELSGFSFMGGRDLRLKEPPRPGAPLIRVRAFALMGGVTVRSKPPKGTKRRFLRRG